MFLQRCGHKQNLIGPVPIHHFFYILNINYQESITVLTQKLSREHFLYAENGSTSRGPEAQFRHILNIVYSVSNLI